MKKYTLNKNFALIECQAESLIYPTNDNVEKAGKKETTLYLNETALFILKRVLMGENLEEIVGAIEKKFSISGKDKQELREQVKSIIEKLEKTGVIIS